MADDRIPEVFLSRIFGQCLTTIVVDQIDSIAFYYLAGAAGLDLAGKTCATI